MDTPTYSPSMMQQIIVRFRGIYHGRTGKHRAVLAMVGAGFFLLYLWPSFRMPTMFISPDETANYFFSKLVADTASLRSPMPYGGYLGTEVAPRSILTVDGSYAPGSFLGLPILTGIFAKFLGAWAILVLPVLLASITPFFLYEILRRFFSPGVSFLSSLMLFIHPAFWYFASRPMYHNALFLSLLIIGGYSFLRIAESGRISSAVAASALLSLALWTRTSEIVWILPIIVLLFFKHRHHLPRACVLLFFGIFSILGARLLTINAAVYGDALGSGYTTSIETTSDSAITATVNASIARLVLPFGIHIDRIARAVWQYFFAYMPWFGLLFVIGVALNVKAVLQKKLVKKRLWFLGSALAVMAWLFAYYGSYQFQEFSDPDRLLPSISYLRYWLPAYALSLPFCAIALLSLCRNFPRKRFARTVAVLTLLAVVLLSARNVLLDPLLGLAQVRKTVFKMERTNAAVQNVTEVNAVIIAGYSDKAFFPDRFVMVRIPQDPKARDDVFSRVLSRTTLYFYRNVAETVSKRDWTMLAGTSWSLTPVVRDGDNTLYAINTPPQPTLETNGETE